MIFNIYFLSIAIFLFISGAIVFFIKKDLIFVFMSIEIMLNGINLFLLSLYPVLKSQILIIFIITVAAGEAAVGLAMILNLSRIKGDVEVDTMRILKG
ncbi:MAG: NADH-quinone oxidoreductase subunit NuoK [Candidatus Aminicenantia bacterium]